MNLTRRAWAKVAAVAMTTGIPSASAQTASPQTTPNTKEALLNNARAQVQGASRILASVPLPRATEPAERFEAGV